MGSEFDFSAEGPVDDDGVGENARHANAGDDESDGEGFHAAGGVIDGDAGVG